MKADLDRQLLALKLVVEGLDEEELARLLAVVERAPRVYVAGLGRSGDVLRAFASRLVRAGRTAYPILESHAPPVESGDLVVVGSGSGTTGTVLAAAARAAEAGATLVVLTGNALSPLARMAHHRVLFPPSMPLPQGDRPPGGEEEFLEPLQALFEEALLLVLDQVAAKLGATASHPRLGGVAAVDADGRKSR